MVLRKIESWGTSYGCIRGFLTIFDVFDSDNIWRVLVVVVIVGGLPLVEIQYTFFFFDDVWDTFEVGTVEIS